MTAITGLTRGSVADYSRAELAAVRAPAPYARAWWQDGTWRYELLWGLRVGYVELVDGPVDLHVPEPLRRITGTLGATAAPDGFATRASSRGALDWRDRVYVAQALHEAAGELLDREALVAAYVGKPER